MEYKTLYVNDNGTAKVQMTVDGHVLEQDITVEGIFEDNVKSAMAIFKKELDVNITPEPEVELDTPVAVEELPEIPQEDNEPETVTEG